MFSPAIRAFAVVLAASALLVGCASSDKTATAGPIFKDEPQPLFAATPAPGKLTIREQVLATRLLKLENLVCSKVYPAPKDDITCFEAMSKKLSEVFPDGAKKAEDLNIRAVPKRYSVIPELEIVWSGVSIVIASCRGEKDQAACFDKASHAVLRVFDPHSDYLSAAEFKAMQDGRSGAFFGVGMEIRGLMDKTDPIVVVNPIKGSPAEKAGILPGDKVIAIDGKQAESFDNLTHAVNSIRGPLGSKVTLTIERAGTPKPFPVTIVRGKIETLFARPSLIKEGGKTYGLIEVTQFGDGTCAKTKEAYEKVVKDADGRENLSGLIISVEKNPGGLLHEVVCMLDLFTEAQSFVLYRDRDGITPYTMPTGPGGAPWLPPQPGDITSGLPILVMVNGGSASAAEIFAAGMQHMRRSMVGGTPTFQKGSVQNVVPLEGGAAVKITIAEYLVGTEKDWIPVQCIGVIPDLPFDRGFDPVNDKGVRMTECSLAGSIVSGGAMPAHPTHSPWSNGDKVLAEEMLEVYKKRVAKEDQELKERIERLKKNQKK